MRHFLLTRGNSFVEVSLDSQTAYHRQVKFVDGDKKDTTLKVHPEGVAWGKTYPKLFSATEQPQALFVHKGRAIIGPTSLNDIDKTNIPEKLEYRFQPFICDVIDSIHAKENVLLTGGTGVGKTTHIMQLAARIGQPVMRINFNGETRLSDLLGKMMVINGETIWVDGTLPSAMRKGYWLLLDELDFADPAVLSLLHPVLESSPSLTLKENCGEVIKPNHGFRIFATANSIGAMSERSAAYDGTNKMNEAFLDRWNVVLVDNLPAKEEIKVLKSEVPSLKLSVAKKMVAFANRVRTNADMPIDFGDNFSTRKLITWAKKTALHRNPIVGAKKAWLHKMPESDQAVVIRLLQTDFGAGKSKKNAMKKLRTGRKL